MILGIYFLYNEMMLDVYPCNRDVIPSILWFPTAQNVHPICARGWDLGGPRSNGACVPALLEMGEAAHGDGEQLSTLDGFWKRARYP